MVTLDLVVTMSKGLSFKVFCIVVWDRCGSMLTDERETVFQNWHPVEILKMGKLMENGDEKSAYNVNIQCYECAYI